VSDRTPLLRRAKSLVSHCSARFAALVRGLEARIREAGTGQPGLSEADRQALHDVLDLIEYADRMAGWCRGPFRKLIHEVTKRVCRSAMGEEGDEPMAVEMRNLAAREIINLIVHADSLWRVCSATTQGQILEEVEDIAEEELPRSGAALGRLVVRASKTRRSLQGLVNDDLLDRLQSG